MINASSELRAGLVSIAKRSIQLMGACANEESTKLYLVLPMIGLLGYDATDPLEVYPRHETDPTGDNKQIYRADFAILSKGQPVIAACCARAGADPDTRKGELAGYFKAWSTAKLGILSNGILFEFFVDSANPGQMDEEPFLTIDLQTAAQSGVPDDVLETLVHTTKADFDAERIAELAHLQLVKKRLRIACVEEAQAPSKEFCRAMMQRIGFPSVRTETIESHYAPLLKDALEEALVLPVVNRLKTGTGNGDGKTSGKRHQLSQGVATAERELALFNYVRRRLAYLVEDEALFQAVDSVDYKDYVGKLVVYFDKDPKGRLFELIRGAEGLNKFIFPEPYGEIVTSNIVDIDEALRATFLNRVREVDPAAAVPERPAGRRFARSA